MLENRLIFGNKYSYGMKKLLFILFLFCSLVTTGATNSSIPKDSLRISLLTCSPGKQIYTLFGHTALRVTIPHTNYDTVYNYGVFDFNTPNFLGKFIVGDTHYQLGKVPFDYFIYEYDASNRTVWEQELNLTQQEKVKLKTLLEDNYKPQNRFYKYNYFYDNCSTRPLLKITEATSRKITLPEDASSDPKQLNQHYSYRSLVHKYTHNHPWSQFGMDLLLGSEADEPISVIQKVFIPIELMLVAQSATIGSNSLTKDNLILIDNQSMEFEAKSLLLTPLFVFGLFFLSLIVLSIYQLRKNKTCWGVDLTLFFICGIIGCILAFMVLFSEQPTVSTNYLLLVFHPLHLIFAPILAYKEKKRAKCGYHYFNLGLLTLFIAFFWLIPQYISLTILTLAGSLLIRSLTHILIQTRK